MTHASNAVRMGLVIVLAAGLLSGCRNREEDQAKYKVALVMKSLANEFFVTMEKGARAHQKKNPALYSLIVNGLKDEKDVAGQIKIVQQMIDQGVDAIVIAPADSKALSPILQKAQKAGIAVVNIDNKLHAGVLKERGMKVPFAGPDNREGARLAGEYLAKTLKAGDQVAIVEGAPNAFNGEQRKLGFQDAMKTAGIVVATSQTGRWMKEDAEKVVTGMVSNTDYDLKAILCANDEMALGAVTALKSAGALGKVKVIGFDNITAIRKLMDAGHVLCTVDQHADQIAVTGIEMALEMLEKKTTPADKKTPVGLVTR